MSFGHPRSTSVNRSHLCCPRCVGKVVRRMLKPVPSPFCSQKLGVYTPNRTRPFQSLQEVEPMRGIDYTRLSGGTKIGDLEIETCTYCGRNGLVETINGKTFYTHEEG